MENAIRGFWHHLARHPERSLNWCHLDRLRSNTNLWKHKFPEIQPYYAVKCNPHPSLINALTTMGYSFDCASADEIKQVKTSFDQNTAITGSQVQPSIIFANPIKGPYHLLEAKTAGVRLMTADCPEEIDKIKQYYPNAEILLRIAVDDSQSICKFNTKFGLVPEEANLIKFFDKFRKNSDPKVIGVSFHVGSGCLSALSYKDAIEKSQYVFDFATKYGINMNILDIGGGFMPHEPLLTNVSQALHNALRFWKQSRPQTYPKQVIAEPGRFISHNVFDLYVTVIGKKKDGNTVRYYINDGAYGSFNCIMFDHVTDFKFDVYRQLPGLDYPQKIATQNPNGHWDSLSNKGTPLSPRGTLSSTIFGQTCDSIDVILKDKQIPELEVGDHLCFHNMGAYTLAAATNFNGFPVADVYTLP